MWQESNNDNSADFIEDPYFNPQDSTATPSLDEVDDDSFSIIDSPETEFDLFDVQTLTETFKSHSLESNDGSLNIETEFYKDPSNSILKKVLRKDDKKQVRVTFSDLTKPYLAKMSSERKFKEYLGLTSDEAYGPASGDFTGMTADEADRQRLVWESELAQIEEEIATLRTVLASKVRTSNELKRKLGITVWRELSEDVNQGLKNVKESNVYQKTTSILGGITGTVTNKIGQMRHSESFRSIEEKVGSAYENVKTKVSSRSNSMQSLDEAFNQHQATSVRSPPATSPTISEEKPLA